MQIIIIYKNKQINLLSINICKPKHTNMKLKTLLIVSILITSTVHLVKAQDYFGYSNFGGIGSVISNPANIAASRYKFNFNIMSTNFYVGSNMYELDNKRFFSFNFNNLQQGKDFNTINSGDTKRFTGNVDFLGPSILFNINKTTALGITTRLRTLINFDNLSNNGFNVLTGSNTDLYNQNYTESNVGFNVHSFADFGITFAKQVFKTQSHDVKIGITLKLVKGIAAGAVRINKLDVLNLKNADTLAKVKGDVSIAYSKNAEGIINGDMTSGFSQISSSGPGSCIATDIGVVYEFKKGKKYPYQLRLGLSITDLSLSSLTYNNGSQGGQYLINNNNMQNIPSTTISQLQGESYEQYLQRLSAQSFLTVVQNDSAADFTMNLPTALHVNADIHLIKYLYTNVYFLINLRGADTYGTNYFTSTYIVSPRIDKKWFSMFMPFSYNSLNEFNWGVGFKFGPLFVGSGSVFSNMIKSRVHNTDLKLALSIPVFRSYKSTQK